MKCRGVKGHIKINKWVHCVVIDFLRFVLGGRTVFNLFSCAEEIFIVSKQDIQDEIMGFPMFFLCYLTYRIARLVHGLLSKVSLNVLVGNTYRTMDKKGEIGMDLKSLVI